MHRLQRGAFKGCSNTFRTRIVTHAIVDHAIDAQAVYSVAHSVVACLREAVPAPRAFSGPLSPVPCPTSITISDAKGICVTFGPLALGRTRSSSAQPVIFSIVLMSRYRCISGLQAASTCGVPSDKKFVTCLHERHLASMIAPCCSRACTCVVLQPSSCPATLIECTHTHTHTDLNSIRHASPHPFVHILGGQTKTLASPSLISAFCRL